MRTHYSNRRLRYTGVAVVLLCAGVALSGPLQEAPQDDPQTRFLRTDPEKIQKNDQSVQPSSDPCGQCHAREYEVWFETPHARGFDELHKKETSRGILANMGFRLTKRESLCLRCHYTAKLVDGTPRAVAGVSCESCHGAARDWITVHNKYGEGNDHNTEPSEHRDQRILQSTEAGMLRPSDNLYGVAANCFECHSIPEEKLINVGGHPSISAFELVAWSDSIRHNFVRAQWSEEVANRERPPERKRLMYIAGRALDYEYTLRAAARASERGTFFNAVVRKKRLAHRALEKIFRLAPLPEIQSILLIGKETELAPNDAERLLAAADHIGEHTRNLLDMHDGAALEALDPLIAGEDVASPEPEPLPSTDAATDSVATPPVADGTPPASPDAAPGTQPDSPPAPAAVPVVGEKKRRPGWFPPAARYATTLPGCSCHKDANAWWNHDRHYSSAFRLLEGDPKALAIAQRYGLTASQMKRGNQICMNCHGTIITGDEAEEVFDGVSCESCHGASSGFLDVHKRGGGAGFDLGQKRLQDASVRAQNCSRCHHITDRRLISSGHPTGEGYDFAASVQKIKHWPDPANVKRTTPYPEVGASALRTAFARITSARPVPAVQRPVLPPSTAAPPSGVAPPGSRARPGTTPGRRPPRARPVPSRTRFSGAATSLDLPPFPAVSDSTSTEELLLIIKRRLELIHRALRERR